MASKILWVEPDVDDLELFGEVLQKYFAGEIIHCKTPYEAVQFLHTVCPEDCPDLIITEYEKTWKRFYDEMGEVIHQVPKKIDIVVLTGNQDPLLPEKVPAIKVVRKPFSYQQIPETVRHIVEGIQ